jgi:non-specific serine/threonine protein kinase
LALQEESLALRRELGDQQGIATSLHHLGLVAYSQGEYGRARALQEEALALFRELGDKRGSAASLLALADVAYQQGEYERTAVLHEEGLLLGRDIGARDLVAAGLESLAWVVAARGQPHRAARIGGAAEALRAALGEPLAPEMAVDHDRAVQAMRAVLGAGAFTAAWAEGRALQLEEAVALALEGAPAT